MFYFIDSIVLMTISGSIFFLLFLISRRILHNYLTRQNEYFLLKICLLSFILPFYLFIYGFRLLLYRFHAALFSGDVHFSRYLPTVIFTPDEVFMNTPFQIGLFLNFLWIIMAVLIMMKQLIRYIHFKKKLKVSSRIIFEENIQHYTLELCKEFQIVETVSFCTSPLVPNACTCGLFHPVIFLPFEELTDELKLIIRHELIHVKHRDLLFRLLAIICKDLFWFNPMIYWVVNEFDQVSELACDEAAVSLLTNADRKSYADLVIRASTVNQDPVPLHFTHYFHSNKDFIKERIDCIMKRKPQKNHKLFLTPLLTVIFLALSNLPAMASPVPQMLGILATSSSVQPEEMFQSDFAFYFDTNSEYATAPVTVMYPEQFTLPSGEIFEVTEEHKKMRANCSHTFVEGTYEKHTPDGSGGCTLKRYRAKRCSKCGYIEIGTLIDTTISSSCPH